MVLIHRPSCLIFLSLETCLVWFEIALPLFLPSIVTVLPLSPFIPSSLVFPCRTL